MFKAVQILIHGGADFGVYPFATEEEAILDTMHLFSQDDFDPDEQDAMVMVLKPGADPQDGMECVFNYSLHLQEEGQSVIALTKEISRVDAENIAISQAAMRSKASKDDPNCFEIYHVIYYNFGNGYEASLRFIMANPEPYIDAALFYKDRKVDSNIKTGDLPGKYEWQHDQVTFRLYIQVEGQDS